MKKLQACGFEYALCGCITVWSYIFRVRAFSTVMGVVNTSFCSICVCICLNYVFLFPYFIYKNILPVILTYILWMLQHPSRSTFFYNFFYAHLLFFLHLNTKRRSCVWNDLLCFFWGGGRQMLCFITFAHNVGQMSHSYVCIVFVFTWRVLSCA